MSGFGDDLLSSEQSNTGIPMTQTATQMLSPSSSSFFSTTPVSGNTEPDGTFVGVPSRYMRKLGDYFLNQTVPVELIKFMTSANSRNARLDTANNRLWTSTWSSGWCRWLWSQLAGSCFVPAEINTSRRLFAFDSPNGQQDSGSCAAVRSSAAYGDLSHLGFGSYSDDSEGPGGGVAMDGDTASFSQYVRSMTSGNLPSDMLNIFGISGLYGDYLPMAGDSLLTSDVEAEMTIVYARGPGFGTWAWEHVTETASNGTGDRVATDPEDDLVSSAGESVATHTVIGDDDFTTRTFTFDTPPADWSDVLPGMAVTFFESGGSFRAFGVIESVAGSAFTVKWALTDPPVTGDTAVFGPVDIDIETYTMPATTAEFRGPRLTNVSGLNVILGFGVNAVGTNGFSAGMHGWSGQGYETHLSQWPRQTWYGELCNALGINLAILHEAAQQSDRADMVNGFPSEMTKGAPGLEIYLAGDPEHAVVATSAYLYGDAIYEQATFSGSSSSESPFTGTHWMSWLMGHKDNDQHPNMIGHAECIRSLLNVAAYLPEAIETESILIRSPDLVFDIAIKSASPSTNFSGDATITVAHNTSGPTTQRAILRFKRPTRLQPGNTIDSANLTLSFSSGSGVDDAKLIFAAVEGGAMLTEDATWTNIDATTAWNDAGGTYDDSVFHSAAAANGVLSVTYNIRRTVEQALILNPQSEYIDILIRMADETATETVTFNAYAEDGSAPDSDAPTLDIAYRPTKIKGGGGSIGGSSQRFFNLSGASPSRRSSGRIL